jgi:hypothetical protein
VQQQGLPSVQYQIAPQYYQVRKQMSIRQLGFGFFNWVNPAEG